MRKPTSLYSEGSKIAAGLKAAVVVAVLGVLAATVDHATLRPYTGPQITDHAVPTAYTETTVGSLVLPAELRPNESDVTAPVATF